MARQKYIWKDCNSDLEYMVIAEYNTLLLKCVDYKTKYNKNFDEKNFDQNTES